MAKGRKIVVYIASSVDGYIARKDGSVDWLNRPRTAGDYGMGAFFKTIDTIVWGRKTYDMAAGFAKKGGGLGYGSAIKNYVFTHHPPTTAVSGVEFITEQVSTFAQGLKTAQGKDIWIMGGAAVVASFLDAGQIDEFIINVVPTIIGEGVPLITPDKRLIPLTLRSSESFADGVVRLHYSVGGALPQIRKKSPRRST
ncbi:MAG TPA: dihydrofolate reductase family protein [Pyrinomonadaceae bacterium]|nr:dihydrofolate reductase family protein [Pyrinomonadaceae bacterium]